MTEAELQRWKQQQRRFAAARVGVSPATKKEPQRQVVLKRASSSAARVGGTAAARTRATVQHDPPTSGASREEAAPEMVPAPPSSVTLASFTPTSAKAMRVAVDPHEVALSLPAKSFLARCDRCGKDKGSDDLRFCAKCALIKKGGGGGGVNPPREVPPPASTERAALAVVTSEPPRLFLKECTTVDADSGSKCKLLAPHSGYPCRNERGIIRQALQPNEVSRRDVAVVTAALASRAESTTVRSTAVSKPPRMENAYTKKQEWERDKKRRLRAEGDK